MARVIWKGAISFSLIHIPVSLHPASRSASLNFTMLDKRDFSPVGYQRVNKGSGKTVDWSDIVKGYEYRKGEHVVLSDEDFRQANVEATQTIDIQGFVDQGEIPPVYHDTPYYLAADKHGEKVYTLLREALAKSKTVAVGLIVIRTRQHVCALLPAGNTLVLNTLRYADEVLAPEEHAPASKTLEAARVSQREFDMALRLVEDMRQKWDPSSYQDSYREDLLQRIEDKVRAGETRTLTPTAAGPAQPRSAEVVDLTELLKRSLEQRGAKGASARRTGTPPAPSARTRSPAAGTRRRRSA